MRHYSAMAVVISSSVLVAGTNLASGQDSDSFLFGQWGGESQSAIESPRALGQMSKGNSLAVVPLVKATSEVETELKKEEDNSAFVTGEALVSGADAPMKDPEEDGGVEIYVVKEGDSISSIAVAHKITVNTVLWANDIDNVDSIKPGDQIFILPVAGLKYVVKKGDDIDAIAKKYQAEKDRIISFNDLPADGKVEEGQEIIIPGGRKDEPAAAPSSTGLERRQYANTSGGAPTVSGWKKLEGKAGAGHKFPYGYCTWYVAQRRYVPWGGNAGAWLYNAKAQGYKTGKAPAVGAIMVSSESWWGHVAVVEKVSGDMITISEMNYKGWAKKSSRTLSAKSKVIKGFIY